MSEKLTIIITSSCIPSHPSIKIIKETIQSLENLKTNKNNCLIDTPIIIAQDHLKNSNSIDDKIRYKFYIKNLEEYIKDKTNIKLVLKKKKIDSSKLVGNIRTSLEHVNTKYILIIQHDLSFIQKCNIDTIINDMENNNKLKHIRFNRLDNLSYDDLHKINTMAKRKKRMDWKNKLYGEELITNSNTYIRTCGWSDNNHICELNYYKDIILKECRDNTYPERRIDYNLDETNHDKYGTYIYGKIGWKPFIFHLDGREEWGDRLY